MAGLFEDDPPPQESRPDSAAQSSAPPPQAEPEMIAAPEYRVLARKYRPTSFDALIGQDALVRTLRNAFAMGRIAHAFMFTGVRGVGKTTTARILARALNCVGPDGTGGPTPDPCGVCANCTAILEDRHPDVIEMDAASNTGVDDVREIIEATRFRPMMARTKMFIIDEVHMLSRNAFNALLKTLEEPPPHVKFAFATTEIRKVPVTVLSRCQRFDLKRVPVETLATHFTRVAEAEEIAAEPEAIAAIARAADGSVRDGLSLLDQAIALGSSEATTITAGLVAGMLGLADRSLVFDLMEAIAEGRIADSFGVLDRAHALGAEPGQVLQDLLGLAHELSRLKSVPGLADSPRLPELERSRGAALAENLSIAWLGRLWQMLLKGTGEIEQAMDRQAAVEMVVIRLCHVADVPPPAELIRRLGGENGVAPATRRAPTAQPSPQPASQRAAMMGGGAATAIAAAPATPAPASPAPVEADPAPRLARFDDVVALAETRREPLLAAQLRNDARLVRFAPPVIELNLSPRAPRDLSPRLAKMLEAATGTRWTIALSRETGAPSLAEAAEARHRQDMDEALAHPLVRAVLDAFPGARVQSLHKTSGPDTPPADPPDTETDTEEPTETDP